MRLKKLHFIGSLLVAAATITTLSSNSTGITGRSSVGCGDAGCHGTQSAAASILLNPNLPVGGWVPGTTYHVTLSVTNAAETKAGFDLTVNVGTISNGSTGTMVMGTEIHHTTPQVLTSGTATWTFDWTAPSSRATPLTMNVACNTVNGNGAADANDHWNTSTITKAAATGSSIATFNEGGYSIYPNPAKDQLMLTVKDGKDVVISAASMNGSFIALNAEKVATDKYRINTANLASGAYVLMLRTEGKTFATRFVKQ